MNKNSLTEGPILGHTWRLTGPMLLAIVAYMSFNVVDTYFVSRLGEEQLVAISFSFPVVMILMNLAIGYGIGSTSVLSRLVGESRYELAKNLGSLSVALVVIFSLLLVIVGISTTEPVFKLLGAQPEHMGYIYDYMKWAYPAMALRMIAISISSLFKSNGLTNIPSRAMIIVAILNGILDPILIFGYFGFPAMGIAGAGLASFISNLLATIYEFWVGYFRFRFIQLPQRIAETELERFKEIFSIGIPSAVASALNPISVSIGNFLLAMVSTAAVAGYGVGSKIQIFSMIPILALSSATGPLVGQNISAKKYDRVRDIIKFVFGFAILWSIVQYALLYTLAEPIGRIFSEKPEILNTSTFYLRLVGLSLVGYSFVILTNSILNASNQPIRAFLIILGRALIWFLVGYFIFNYFDFEQAVIWAIFFSNTVSFFFAIYQLRHFLKNTLK
ncbi:MAG: MATE family efflux transporter [Bdellovibrionales bacterium]